MTHGSLFSGIGGFDYAAQQMGWQNVFHCEIEPFPRKILNYYWPESHSLEDIHNLTVDNYGNLLYLNDQNVITMGQKKSSKYDHAVSLYEGGMSIQECANFYEISRQAMHNVLKRRNCVFRSNLKFGEENHFFRGCLPDRSKKERVHDITEKAIKRGALVNPNKCEKCGCDNRFKDGRSGIQAHHSDYDKPLDVIWLCQKCHHQWHIENKAINEADIEKLQKPSGAVELISGGFP